MRLSSIAPAIIAFITLS